MSNAAWAIEEVKRLRNDPDFERELLLLEINELLIKRMNALGWRKADLAKKLRVSRPFVTKLFNGNENLTIGTLVRVANVLGLKVRVNMQPRYVFDFIEGHLGDLIEDTSAEPLIDQKGTSNGEQQLATAA